MLFLCKFCSFIHISTSSPISGYRIHTRRVVQLGIGKRIRRKCSGICWESSRRYTELPLGNIRYDIYIKLMIQQNFRFTSTIAFSIWNAELFHYELYRVNAALRATIRMSATIFFSLKLNHLTHYWKIKIKKQSILFYSEPGE